MSKESNKEIEPPRERMRTYNVRCIHPGNEPDWHFGTAGIGGHSVCVKKWNEHTFKNQHISHSPEFWDDPV